MHVRRNNILTSARLFGGVGVGVTSDTPGTEVDTNGQTHRPQKKTCAPAAHVSLQQIKRGRTVIPRGVTEKRKQQNLDSRGMAENKERGWSIGAKRALPGSSASRLIGWGGGHRIQLNTGGIIEDNAVGEGENKLAEKMEELGANTLTQRKANMQSLSPCLIVNMVMALSKTLNESLLHWSCSLSSSLRLELCWAVPR